jgi:hypothetical protein
MKPRKADHMTNEIGHLLDGVVSSIPVEEAPTIDFRVRTLAIVEDHETRHIIMCVIAPEQIEYLAKAVVDEMEFRSLEKQKEEL